MLIGDGTFLMARASSDRVAVRAQGHRGRARQRRLRLDRRARANEHRRQRRQPLRRPRGRAARRRLRGADAASFGCRGVRADDAAGAAAGAAPTRARGDRTTVIHCPTVPGRPLPPSGAFWDLGVPEAGDERPRRSPRRSRGAARAASAGAEPAQRSPVRRAAPRLDGVASRSRRTRDRRTSDRDSGYAGGAEPLDARREVRPGRRRPGRRSCSIVAYPAYPPSAERLASRARSSAPSPTGQKTPARHGVQKSAPRASAPLRGDRVDVLRCRCSIRSRVAADSAHGSSPA